MVLLLAHSHYSFLTAPSSPRALCEEAVRRGHRALALVDLNGLYGFHAFAREAQRVGLKPLFGVDLVHHGRRLIAIARDRAGYRSLCRLVTARHLREDFDLVRDAEENAEGLTFLCGDLESATLGSESIVADSESVTFDSDPNVTDSRKAPDPVGFAPRHERRELARVLDLPLLTVRDVWYAQADDRFAQAVFLAVKHNRALDEARAIANAHVPDAEPQDAATQELIDSCTLDLAGPFAPVFPAFTDGDAAARLRELAESGLRRRFSNPTPAHAQRLQRELATITRMGFAPYFLVVHEIAEGARARGIPLLGRGSAADSLVAYALGLTDADPIRYGLLFERFLNPARSDLPDIDLDFCWRRRDEVLASVYERFGHDHVAMIATHVTFGARAAYREAGKALSLPAAELGRRTALLPWHWHGSRPLADVAAGIPGFYRARLSAERERRLAECAGLLLEAPRHLGIHPGGTVITPTPIAGHAPLERAAKGLVITQYEMHAVEALGLVKIDLLGNRALTIVADARAALRARGVVPPPFADLPENDPATARLLREGRTLACFQVESPGMRALLRQIEAANLDRVIQAIALIRPGPAAAGMKERFARRARGLEPVTLPHPILEPLFRETFGVMLYQEDVIRAAMAVAGVEAAQGDELRRHLGKVRGGDPAQKDAFLVAGLRTGLATAAVEEVWDAMARFAAFSFCKAHAVTYGRLAYECVWLKAHHPAAFLAAMLGNDAGYYAKGVYVEEAKRLGVRLRRPCVHRSSEAFGLEADPPSGLAIRVPLSEVRGLSATTLRAVHDARRAGGRFHSLEDFLRRTQARRDEAENLVRCGALDDLALTRPQLLLALRARAAPAPAGPELIRGALAPRELPLPPLPEYSTEQRAAFELELLGYTLDAHPVDVLFGTLRRRDVVPLGDAEAHLGRTIQVHGWIVAERRIDTVDGMVMMFFTLEDGTGVLEATLFPDAYRRLGGELQGRGPFLVRGRVESQLGGVSLRVTGLAAVS